MTDHIYTLATYVVKEGMEEQFVAAQRELQDSALSMESPAERGSLLRRMDDPSAYISFGVWRSRDDAMAWRGSPGFADAFARVTEACEEVVAGPCEVVIDV